MCGRKPLVGQRMRKERTAFGADEVLNPNDPIESIVKSSVEFVFLTHN
jgi:hypothetical protein